MDRARKVLVVGGGPAGLGAGIHLLENGDERLEVHMALLHDRLGGKASSWRVGQAVAVVVAAVAAEGAVLLEQRDDLPNTNSCPGAVRALVVPSVAVADVFRDF